MTNFKEKKGKWLSVRKYAQKACKSRAQIYLDIRLGKINKNKVRVIEFSSLDCDVKIKRKQVFWEGGIKNV